MVHSHIDASEVWWPRAIGCLFSFETLTRLPPRVGASYVHNGIKLLARWAAVLAGARDDVEALTALRAAAQAAKTTCVALVVEAGRRQDDYDDVELTERASQVGMLLQYLSASLEAAPPSAPRGVPTTSPGGADWGGAVDVGGGRDVEEAEYEQTAGIAGLNLLAPLFDAYELNPVAQRAQEMLAPPEGLDLESWIVPPATGTNEDEPMMGGSGDVDEYGRRKGPAASSSTVGAHEGDRRRKHRKGKGKGTKTEPLVDVADEVESKAQVREPRHGMLFWLHWLKLPFCFCPATSSTSRAATR